MKSLTEAISTGMHDFFIKKNGPAFSLDDCIRFRVAEYIWDTFREIDVSDDTEVLEALQKITR
jgi:hypothetical protein